MICTIIALLQTEYAIFFFQNFGSAQSLSHMCAERLPATSIVNREPPPSLLDRQHAPHIAKTQCDSHIVLPDHNTSAPISSALCPLPTNVPVLCTVSSPSCRVSPGQSSSLPLRAESSVGGNAVASRNWITFETIYKRISDLVEPEFRINMYGVISSIIKVTVDSECIY